MSSGNISLIYPWWLDTQTRSVDRVLFSSPGHRHSLNSGVTRELATENIDFYVHYCVKTQRYLLRQKSPLIKLPKDRTEILGYRHRKHQDILKNAPLSALVQRSISKY